MAMRGVVGISLDKDRTLMYRTKDLIEAERSLGMPFLEALTKVGATPCQVFLKCGLQHEDEKITLDRVVRLMDAAFLRGATFATLWNKIGEAMMASGWIRAPEPEADAGADP